MRDTPKPPLIICDIFLEKNKGLPAMEYRFGGCIHMDLVYMKKPSI